MVGGRLGFVNGTGIISPQRTYEAAGFLDNILTYSGNHLSCDVPDFKQYIPPNQIRRLSKMLRIGLTAATICKNNSGGRDPDGIITATGYGLLQDTEKFLVEILEQNETHLTPTFFMQSTYNALSGLVGLAMNCEGYNNTYVSKGHAFEMALHDALIQVRSKPSLNFLIGAFDEVNDVHLAVHSRVGHYKKEKILNLQLFDHATPGSLQGEGAAFFSVSGEARDESICAILGLKMLFDPDHQLNLTDEVGKFLNEAGVSGVDLLISGESGDVAHDQPLKDVAADLFEKTPLLKFKHLCGEYCVASSFGLWLGATMLRLQQVPAAVRFNDIPPPPVIRNVLMINQYMGRNYSFLFLGGIR